jgi:adenylate cyclase
MKKQITLRISILSLYAGTFIILMSLLISISAINYLNSIFSVAKNLLSGVSDVVLEELNLEINSAEALGKLTQSLLVSDYPLNQQSMINYTLYIAKNIPSPHLPNPARIAAWGDVNGNSIETTLETDGTYSTGITFLATKAQPNSIRLYRDPTDRIIKREVMTTDYDPRLRPWYIAAINAKRFIWSDVFLSYPYKNPSTSASVPVYDKSGKLLGVFEIEIKLVGLSNFLSTLKIGKDAFVFIINAKNELIAFPGMRKEMTKNAEIIKLKVINKPWLSPALEQQAAHSQEAFSYQYAGMHYLALFKNIPRFSAYGWKIGVVVPKSSFVGDMERKNIYIILVGIGFLFIGLLIALFISKRISNPMKLLVAETERIKNFNLEGGRVGHSILKEVDSLADAIYSMKINLRSFQKYMPASLVRQLIQSGEDIQLGGSKKTLTIFFSDIKNFTALSEKMDPEHLLFYLCEYFDEFSQIISAENGTIDKYIGDSIMAFWGAPLPDKDHCEHACRAALECKARLAQLNVVWKEQGKPPLFTRIGLHMGEVIVGNVGSSERVNYTALGDSINLASRLEGLGKVYGVSIICSEDVMKIAKQKFVFRMLDQITVRGKIGSYTIYELLAEQGQQLKFDIHAYSTSFENGFTDYQKQQWQVAIQHFNQCLLIYPEDNLAHIFISRCETFLKNPPPADWNGVWTSH